MKKRTSYLALGLVSTLFAGIISSSYRVSESVATSIAWEQGQADAVLLKSGDKTIGLSHWSDQILEERNGQPFFEPGEVSYVFSCYPELLPEEVRERHVFPKASGVQFQGRVGRLLILSKGVI